MGVQVPPGVPESSTQKRTNKYRYMNNPTYLVDVDGVVADLIGGIICHLASKRIYLDREDFISTEFSQCGPIISTWGPQVLALPSFASNLPLLSGTVKAIQRLSKTGNIVFVTAPSVLNPTWVSDRQEWLRRITLFSYSYGYEPRIIFAQKEEKPLIQGSILFEDNPYTIAAWLQENPGKQGVLIQQPWNREAYEVEKFWTSKAINPARVDMRKNLAEAVSALVTPQ